MKQHANDEVAIACGRPRAAVSWDDAMSVVQASQVDVIRERERKIERATLESIQVQPKTTNEVSGKCFNALFGQAQFVILILEFNLITKP